MSTRAPRNVSVTVRLSIALIAAAVVISTAPFAGGTFVSEIQTDPTALVALTSPTTPQLSPTPMPTALPPASVMPTAAPTASPTASPAPTASPSPTPKPTAKPTPRPTPKPPATYAGKNHLWVPALGMSEEVRTWGCKGGTLPNYVYIWTCAGTNNLYLLGHNNKYVFGPFVSYYDRHGKALPKGMDLYYANSKGKVTHYKLTFTKIVRYGSDAQMRLIYDNLGTPSVTIQTCYRGTDPDLMIRFVKVP